MKRIAGIVHMLDEFHLGKYLTRIISYIKDNHWVVADKLRRMIQRETKKIADCLKGYLQKQGSIRRIAEVAEYILSNWTAAILRIRHKEGVVGCSTEGYVSHVLASKMSSKPMVYFGYVKIARLRAYHLNGGDMLEPVRY